MQHRLWLSVALLAALAGCSTMGDTSIENRGWLLVEENGGTPVAIATEGEPVYLELDSAESRVTGNAPCNRFFGTYELSAGNRLQFGPDIGATRRACAQLELEGEFLAMLGRVDAYVVADGVLELQRTGAPLARFRAGD